MSKQILISMLRQGNTGTEILSILNAITSDSIDEVANNEPTADMIEFWSLVLRSVGAVHERTAPYSSLVRYAWLTVIWAEFL